MTTKRNPWNEFIELLDALVAEGSLKNRATADALERFASFFDEEVDRSQYRGELGLKLVEIGNFADAERIVSSVESAHDRAHYWRRLAEQQFRLSETDRALTSVLQSDEAINALPGDWFAERAELLSLNARLLDEFGLRQRALRMWERAIDLAKRGQAGTPSSSDCSAVMTTMAKLLGESGRLDIAKSLADSITIPGRRALAHELIEKASRQ